MLYCAPGPGCWAGCPQPTPTAPPTWNRGWLQAAAEAAVARAAALLRKEEAIEGQLGALQQEAEERWAHEPACQPTALVRMPSMSGACTVNPALSCIAPPRCLLQREARG